jgi:predicted adenylyl cyclase CyaB
MRPVCSRILKGSKGNAQFDTFVSRAVSQSAAYPGVTCVSRNVEIKAHIASVETLLPQVQALADQGPFEILQDDTYFVCSAGKLKLRMFSPERGELIYYERAQELGPKESFYLRVPTATPGDLRELLTLAHGQVGRVQKQRTVFLVGRTRVHLDRVAGLGEFLELEVVLDEKEPSETGVREANQLLTRLSVEPSQLIEGGYLDLMSNGSVRGGVVTGRLVGAQ